MTTWASRATTLGLAVGLLSVVPSRYLGTETGRAADSARQIVEEAQKRSEAKSERYEGLLQSFDKSGKPTEKHGPTSGWGRTDRANPSFASRRRRK